MFCIFNLHRAASTFRRHCNEDSRLCSSVVVRRFIVSLIFQLCIPVDDFDGNLIFNHDSLLLDHMAQ